MMLVCHVIAQGHVIKGSCYHPTKFDGHRHCGNEDIVILVCQSILQDHLIKGSCDFMSTNESR